MSRYLKHCLFGLVLAGLLLGVFLSLAPLARAQETTTPPVEPSEQKLQSIRTRCFQIKTSLNQLHTTDALLRVNRGQAYASISSGLMAKLNSRIALNRLDGAELVRITTQYETHYENFRLAYQNYSDSFEELRKIDCREKPREFYEKLVEVRETRLLVNETTKRLAGDISAYGTAFGEFKKSFEQANRGVAGE